jgi:hypothetical protein
VPPSPIRWSRGNFCGTISRRSRCASTPGLLDSLVPTRSALRAFASGKFLSRLLNPLKSIAPAAHLNWWQFVKFVSKTLRLRVFMLNSTLHPVCNFEQSHNRCSKSTCDNHAQVM